MALSIEEMSRMIEIARKNLRQFEFFDERRHRIDISSFDSTIFLGYRTASGNPSGTTHFDLNIYSESNLEICYLADIELLESLRGFGHGKRLYKITEDIGRDLNCNRMRMHPSGWTFDGKSRMDYVLALGGYYPINRVEVEKVL